MEAEPQTQTKQATGIIEPKAICHIGGPLNGKTMADLGQMKHETADGDVYKRVRMNCSKGDLFDVLGYFGKTYEQGV